MKESSLALLLASGGVLRCHTIPCIERPTVGHHTWRTLVLLHWLYFPSFPPAKVTYSLLIHDMPEIVTGDIPGNIKVDNIAVAGAFEMLEYKFNQEHDLGLALTDELSYQEKQLISICDRIDLVLYALDEMCMGNKNMISVIKKAYSMAHVNFIALISSIELILPMPKYLERVETLMTNVQQQAGLAGVSV